MSYFVIGLGTKPLQPWHTWQWRGGYLGIHRYDVWDDTPVEELSHSTGYSYVVMISLRHGT